MAIDYNKTKRLNKARKFGGLMLFLIEIHDAQFRKEVCENCLRVGCQEEIKGRRFCTRMMASRSREKILKFLDKEATKNIIDMDNPLIREMAKSIGMI